MTHVRAHTRTRPNHGPIIDTCLNMCADLRNEREWRALEQLEYALPVLEQDITDALFEGLSEPLDADQFKDVSGDKKQKLREVF